MERILTVFRLHLSQDTQLCVDPHDDYECCNSELQNRKFWMGQVTWIHKVRLDSRRRRERRPVQDRIFHGLVHDGAGLEGICLSRYQWRNKYPRARRNTLEGKEKGKASSFLGKCARHELVTLYVLELMGSPG